MKSTSQYNHYYRIDYDDIIKFNVTLPQDTSRNVNGCLAQKKKKKKKLKKLQCCFKIFSSTALYAAFHPIPTLSK